MSDRAREWCGWLRLQLLELDRMLEQLQTRPIPISGDAQLEAESRLEDLAAAISSKRASVERADTAAREWMQHRQAAEDERAADWKASRDFMMLNTRADEAEAYVAACFELAGAAVREAAHAVIAAALARNDADVASLPEGRVRNR